MKKITLLALVLTGLSLFPTTLHAQNLKQAWFGSWAMNHDGFAGSLIIRDLPADCAAPRWCDMGLSYVDSNGARFSGRIESIDVTWRHMIFYINFGSNRQRFDAYLFSRDRSKLAGTTIWNSGTFGFYANKR